MVPDQEKKNKHKTTIVLITAEFEYKGEGCGRKEQQAASGIRGCYWCALLSSYHARWHLFLTMFMPWAWAASPAAPESPGSSSPTTLPYGFTPGQLKAFFHCISPNVLKFLPFFFLPSHFLADRCAPGENPAGRYTWWLQHVQHFMFPDNSPELQSRNFHAASNPMQ